MSLEHQTFVSLNRLIEDVWRNTEIFIKSKRSAIFAIIGLIEVETAKRVTPNTHTQEISPRWCPRWLSGPWPWSESPFQLGGFLTEGTGLKESKWHPRWELVEEKCFHASFLIQSLQKNVLFSCNCCDKKSLIMRHVFLTNAMKYAAYLCNFMAAGGNGCSCVK